MTDAGIISHASISENAHSVLMYTCTNFGAFISIIKSIKALVGMSSFLSQTSWHVAEVHIDLSEFQWRPESYNVILQLVFSHCVGIDQNLRMVVTIQHFEFLFRMFLSLSK